MYVCVELAYYFVADEKYDKVFFECNWVLKFLVGFNNRSADLTRQTAYWKKWYDKIL